jgi:23S rRNA (guanosine2251-2'-O)-methyltransferase
VIVLDHVLDPHNIGAVARSVAAAGLGGMVISDRRAAPLSATAFKAAAGALETLPISQVSSIADALARLRDLGLWVIGLEADASASLWGQPLLTEPVALVVGEEERGLSRLVRDRVDLLVSIPLVPGSESLNVSVAAALGAFEVKRVRA